MRDRISFKIERLSCWTAGLESLEQWKSWAAGGENLSSERPKIKAEFIPAGLRRRCSNFTRAAIRAAWACSEADDLRSLETIFASRHGETETTLSLLKELAGNEKLSPNEFSLSVHNTSSGLFSIAFENRTPSSSIAAGPDTLPLGLVNSFTRLAEGDVKRVLCIAADEPLPAEFSSDAEAHSPFYAAAFLLALPAENDAPDLTLRISKAPVRAAESLERLFSSNTAGFFRALFSEGERSFTWQGAVSDFQIDFPAGLKPGAFQPFYANGTD